MKTGWSRCVRSARNQDKWGATIVSGSCRDTGTWHHGRRHGFQSARRRIFSDRLQPVPRPNHDLPLNQSNASRVGLGIQHVKLVSYYVCYGIYLSLPPDSFFPVVNWRKSCSRSDRSTNGACILREFRKSLIFLERETGIEPATFSLGS